MRTLAAALAVSVGIGGALVACGGDDQYVQPGGNTDGGKNDGSIGDGGKTDGGDGGTGEAGPTPDGGDAGCAFTAFVISTIANGTKENTDPVPNASIPDPTCSLDGSLQDYASLPGFH